jgi:hypothetical protein
MLPGLCCTRRAQISLCDHKRKCQNSLTERSGSMIDDILRFSTAVLTAGPREKPKSEEGFAIGTIVVPHASPIVAKLLAFGHDGQVYRAGKITAQVVGQPVAKDEWLEVTIKILLGDNQPTTTTANVPYPNEKARQLCKGQWVSAGVGQIKMDPACLMPTVESQADGSVIVGWASPPQVRLGRRWFQWVSTSIRGIKVDVFGGQFLTASSLANWILPTMQWRG